MVKSEYLKQILVCPSCRESLSESGIDIICDGCGKIGTTEENVLNFNTSRDAAVQPAFYDNEEYQKGIEIINRIHNFHYDPFSLSGKLETYFKNELLKIVVDTRRPFFDIGCGTGTGFKHLGYPDEIVGIDISLDLVEACKKSYPEADCVCCDISHPPLRENSLKTVFSLATLEHVFYLERFLESIERLLSDDGYFYVLIPTEGGFAWSILRNIAHYSYSRALKINYKKLLEKDHCNTAHAIDSALKKFFIIDLEKRIPWKIGGNSLNLIRLYRLKKRK